MLDNNGYSVVILTNLSKGFDTMNNDLLIAKLNAYDFSKGSFKLIKSCLTTKDNEQNWMQYSVVDEDTFYKYDRDLYLNHCCLIPILTIYVS